VRVVVRSTVEGNIHLPSIIVGVAIYSSLDNSNSLGHREPVYLVDATIETYIVAEYL
jgi:hypothetical protein